MARDNYFVSIKDIIFGGRLGLYKYFDMHVVVQNALEMVEKELHGE